MADQAQMHAPIYEALLAYRQREVVPLHTPGHKGTIAPEGQSDFLTPLGLACDLPSMEATDSSFHPRGCIADAQRLAAELWGAAETWYLVNGSTIGVQAMVLAAAGPGEKIVLSRHVHLSVIAALVLSGAVPAYLPSHWLERGGPVPPTADEVRRALDANPDARAVLVTHPTYYGVGRDLAPLAEACHRRGVPLLVDEAHGAHLRFLQHDLRSSLENGADVVVQSVHKTAGSLVGTAQLHRGRGGLIPAERLQSMLNLLQSTSSNYLLLASLDLTRRWLWREGCATFHRAMDDAARLRAALDAIDGVETLAAAKHPELDDCHNDPLRLVVDVSGLGMSGFEAERRLYEEFGILDEFCDARNVVFVLGPIDGGGVYRRLEEAFRTLASRRSGSAQPAADHLRSLDPPPVAITPRDAAFRAKTPVPIAAAEGRICGETITMYPPGIPIICPGERITERTVQVCRSIAAQPVCVFAEDASLETITVVTE